MAWGRIQTADGRILSGILTETEVQPITGFAGSIPAGPAESRLGSTLLAPSLPGKFIGLWNNYHAAAERGGLAIPAEPLWFVKPGTSVVGHGATVTLPPQAGRVVFEGELGIVIGTPCRNASPDQAEAAIYGYTCINDLTSLDILNADPAFTQWSRAKGFDGFGVIGPAIVTGLDWRALTIRTLVNGRERQAYPASDMIFSPDRIVQHLSQGMTLMPGDVIAVGTSLGVRPVKAGDVVAVAIDGIGTAEVTLA